MDKIKARKVFFVFYLTLFQVIFIVMMAIFANYSFPKEKGEVHDYYAMFMDVHSMMFIGFGFLMTFLKKYGYSSVGFNFLIAAYVLEWALLVRGWLESSLHDKTGKFEIKLENLLIADFVSASVLISFGSIIGKASLSQLIIMATIQVVLQSVNEFIGLNYLKAYDVGESIYVHVFGAYFGLAVSRILQKEKIESDNEGSNYQSDLFSMIGTLFLWLYWPSFNSAVAVEEGQLRAIINTYLSITSSCIATFVVSLIVGKGKINMVQIQNATLAGGVAVGSVADMVINPFGSMIIGSLAGIVSSLGFQYITPFLNHRGIVHDTCGVNNLHGIPGLLSAFASSVVAAIATKENYYGQNLYKFYPSRIPSINSTDYINENLIVSDKYKDGGLGRTAGEQAGYQIAALFMTLGMAVIGGIVTGLILRLPVFEQVDKIELMFDDEESWLMPSDSKTSSISNNEETVKNDH